MHDFSIEVTSSIRVSNGNGQPKALEEVPRIGYVDDQLVSTFVADGAVGITSPAVAVEVAAQGGEYHVRSGSKLTRMQVHLLEHILERGRTRGVVARLVRFPKEGKGQSRRTSFPTVGEGGKSERSSIVTRVNSPVMPAM